MLCFCCGVFFFSLYLSNWFLLAPTWEWKSFIDFMGGLMKSETGGSSNPTNGCPVDDFILPVPYFGLHLDREQLLLFRFVFCSRIRDEY